MELRNFFSKITILFAALILFVSISPSVFALEYPETEAAAAVLVEGNTGMVLYSSNEDTTAYPASTTKIMTAMLVIEACQRSEISLKDNVTASDTFNQGLEEGGSTADIKAGETMTVEELLYCMLLASANESCNILAEYLSGSISEFVELMNQRAQELGCMGTHFANANGLPDENHYTTAWDLYLITKQSLTYDTFTKITSTMNKTIPMTNMSGIRELENTNALMDTESKYYYENASGVKTGFTNLAGNCLVSTATSDDMYIIAVVMGVNIKLEGMTDADLSDATNFSVTKELYEWAFSSYGYYQVANTSEIITTAPVTLGKGTDSVSVTAGSNISMLLPNDYSADDITWNLSLNSDVSGEELTAPVDEGQVLGEFTLTYGDYTSEKVNLVANSQVELSKSAFIKNELSKTFESVWVKLAVVVVALLIILYIAYAVNMKAKRRRTRNRRRR